MEIVDLYEDTDDVALPDGADRILSVIAVEFAFKCKLVSCWKLIIIGPKIVEKVVNSAWVIQYAIIHVLVN